MPITEEAPMELDEAVDNTVIISMPEIQPTQYPRLGENEFTTQDERDEGTRVQIKEVAAANQRRVLGIREHVDTWKKSFVRNGVLALSALGLLATACGVAPKNIEVTTTPPVATEPAKPTEAPPATIVPATPTVEAPQPLPSVINNETVQFENINPLTAQGLIDIAQQEGKTKLPLPDILKQTGVSLVETKNAKGEKVFAITIDQAGEYQLPNLLMGTVFYTKINDGNFSAIAVANKDRGFVYIAPNQVTSSLGKDNSAALGETLVTLNYQPESAQMQKFKTYLAGQFPEAPANTVVLISAGNSTGTVTTDLTKENILTTITNHPITVSPAGVK